MTNDKSKYTLKHEMLVEFGAQKKSHFIAVVLLTLAGFLGAHRFYLGNKKIGALIVAGTILSAILITTKVSEAYYMLPMVAFMVFLILEYIFVIKAADRINAGIKYELEKKYGLDTFG